MFATALDRRYNTVHSVDLWTGCSLLLSMWFGELCAVFTERNNYGLLFVQKTRKPCYGKDDRAKRPIYGCPEKFRESSQTPPATFPEICKGLLFRSIIRMCTQNLKFVALSVPEIIGGTRKIWALPVYAHAPVSPKFLIRFCSYGPSEYICQI